MKEGKGGMKKGGTLEGERRRGFPEKGGGDFHVHRNKLGEV